MSSSRWRILTAYLPGIASVVNSFQSSDVQMDVYQSLMKALDEKTDAEEAQAAKSKSPRVKLVDRNAVSNVEETELVYDLVDGENIHAMLSKG